MQGYLTCVKLDLRNFTLISDVASARSGQSKLTGPISADVDSLMAELSMGVL